MLTTSEVVLHKSKVESVSVLIYDKFINGIVINAKLTNCTTLYIHTPPSLLLIAQAWHITCVCMIIGKETEVWVGYDNWKGDRSVGGHVQKPL